MTRLMTLAREGRGDEWQAVVRGMRDSVVEHARATSPYWRRAIPAGTPFEAIPPLTKAIVAEHLDELRCAGVPDERGVPARTSGSRASRDASWWTPTPSAPTSRDGTPCR